MHSSLCSRGKQVTSHSTFELMSPPSPCCLFTAHTESHLDACVSPLHLALYLPHPLRLLLFELIVHKHRTAVIWYPLLDANDGICLAQATKMQITDLLHKMEDGHKRRFSPCRRIINVLTYKDSCAVKRNFCAQLAISRLPGKNQIFTI